MGHTGSPSSSAWEAELELQLGRSFGRGYHANELEPHYTGTTDQRKFLSSHFRNVFVHLNVICLWGADFLNKNFDLF